MNTFVQRSRRTSSPESFPRKICETQLSHPRTYTSARKWREIFASYFLKRIQRKLKIRTVSTSFRQALNSNSPKRKLIVLLFVKEELNVETRSCHVFLFPSAVPIKKTFLRFPYRLFLQSVVPVETNFLRPLYHIFLQSGIPIGKHSLRFLSKKK